ncbi:MAG: hypothetical protein J3K34DRAFT_385686 [Monoraphidium minutum]|nr:MAG: hypothetical protein J3K34DRAFT_385686 [Monoraphidium minutum]
MAERAALLARAHQRRAAAAQLSGAATAAAAGAATGGGRSGARGGGGASAAAAAAAPGGDAAADAARARSGRKLIFGRSPVHAWGLFAAEAINPGDFVIQYTGVQIRGVLCDLREQYYEARGQDSSYLFRIDDHWALDATVRGGLARFINHSCDPNCFTRVYAGPGGTKRIGIFGLRRVEAGEELSYDYKFDFEGEERKVPCCCGAKNCRGWMN